MPSNLSRRLTAQDAAFLYLERPHAPLHIGSLGVFEGCIPFERFLAHMDSRIPLIPRYRQRLAFVPLSLAHPTWEDDPKFDIKNHVRRVALPAPGNDQQLREMTTKIFATQLDRRMPLWETYLIEGLEGGRSGVLSKVHHAMIDGVSGMEVLMAILDLSPEPAPAPEASPWEPEPLPDIGMRLIDALRDHLIQQREVFRDFQQAVTHPRDGFREVQKVFNSFRSASPWLALPAPRTPFSVRIGLERRVAFSEVSFVEIREIRTSLGGTVNDVVLAVLAGGLRHYLVKHGYDVDKLELRVAVPVNIRVEEEKGALGNRISAMLTPLPIYESNPAERLALIRDRMNNLKQENQAGAIEALSRLLSQTPVPLQALTGAGLVMNTVVNMICTNVPGPMIPLYSLGHLMLAHYPLVPLSIDMGLGVGVTSYNQRLYFGLMADTKAVPDIDVLKTCVDESFLELRGAAGVSPTDIEIVAPSHNGSSSGKPVAVAEERA
jgi:WS/DGAT/MGAT family acyltransferase